MHHRYFSGIFFFIFGTASDLVHYQTAVTFNKKNLHAINRLHFIGLYIWKCLKQGKCVGNQIKLLFLIYKLYGYSMLYNKNHIISLFNRKFVDFLGEHLNNLNMCPYKMRDKTDRWFFKVNQKLEVLFQFFTCFD